MSAPLDIEPGAEPSAVYRCYDSKGALLYVGTTDHPRMRFKSHSYTARWWPEVTDRTVTWYASRSDAFDAEAAAIRSEAPAHNKRRMNLPPARTALPGGTRKAVVRHNGIFISAMRAKCGLTQAQLAEAAGVSRDHLAHIETESKSTTMITLHRLAKAMGVPTAAMLREPLS